MTPAAELSTSLSPTSPSKGWLLALVLSFAAAVLIVAPFFWLGSASGHDFEFHVASWLDVAGQWKEGIVFPRWAEWPNHGFGEPRFIFYPPLSWLLAPALSFLVPWDYVPVLFIVLVQTFAGFAAYELVRCLFPGRPAVFGAVCYAANPNALLIVYMRSDYAELLASAFFPLLFLGALQLAGILEVPPGRKARSIALFSAALAAVWLSNAPAGVMATYSVALLFVWAAITDKSWSPLIRGAASVALGLGLAGFYLLPATYEQRWVNIGQALSSGLLPSQNFLYTRIDDAEHTFFNWIASTVAVTMIVIAGSAAVAARREGAEDRSGVTEERIWRALLLLAGVATVLMLRPTAFLWQIVPKLRFVQFPWRWMSILGVPFAYFLAATVARQRYRWLWITGVLAVLLGTGTFLARHTWWDDDDIPSLQTAYDQDQGFDGTDEYDPVGDDHYNLPPTAPRLRSLPAATAPSGGPEPKVDLGRWTAEDKELAVTSPTTVRLALRLLDYPAWQVQLNGTTVAPDHVEDTDEMVLELPAGQSRVTVRFTRTWDRTVGGVLSLASALLALGLFVWPPKTVVRQLARSHATEIQES